MSNISVINYQLNDNYKDHIDCPICYKLSKDFFKSKCNHSWCIDCNKKIKSNLCPMCRYEFKNERENTDIDLEYLRVRNEIREIIRIRNRRDDNIFYYLYKIIDKFCCIF